MGVFLDLTGSKGIRKVDTQLTGEQVEMAMAA
jgi:hypothetical protein